MPAQVRSGVVLLILLLAVSGCVFADLLGESSTWVDLYNPATHELAHCGLAMHRGGPSDEEIADRDRCLAEYAAKGFRPLKNSDLPLPQSP